MAESDSGDAIRSHLPLLVSRHADNTVFITAAMSGRVRVRCDTNDVACTFLLQSLPRIPKTFVWTQSLPRVHLYKFTCTEFNSYVTVSSCIARVAHAAYSYTHIPRHVVCLRRPMEPCFSWSARRCHLANTMQQPVRLAMRFYLKSL